MTPAAAAPRRTSIRATVLVGLALSALALTGCSADGSDDGGSTGEAAAGREFAVAKGPDPVRVQAAPAAQRRPGDLVRDRAVISVGVVSLLSKDASDTRADVWRIVDVHQGRVTDEETSTDAEGGVQRSRMVIRLPVADFYETVAQLEQVAELESSDKSSDDVSTEVIDTAVRVRAQERSLRRIEILLARAQSIRDIVDIESELTRRQADLDSLKSQQAYLADQTAMSTITVHLEQKHEPAKEPDTEEAGFLPGLEGGWGALVAFGTVLATILGALLPWLVVLTVPGIPAWLVVRRMVRRRPVASTPAEA